jgi:hypothetical protein
MSVYIIFSAKRPDQEKHDGRVKASSIVTNGSENDLKLPSFDLRSLDSASV